MYEPTQDQIDEQINLAYETDGKLWGASYEQGVRAAIEWMSGETDEPPIEVE